MIITIALQALTGTFTTDTGRATKQFERDMKRIEQNAIKAGKVVGAALAAGATAIAAIVQNQANAIAEFQDLAEKIGDTAENIASLKLAADVSGTAFDTIAAASVKLTAGLAKTEDETKGAGLALRALGIDFDSFLKLSPVEQLDAVAQALAGFEDGAGKTAVAVQLFGKSGADLLPFLNDLADGSERQITLTQEQIQEADAYTKQVARLKSELGLLVTQASAELIPVFADTLDVLKNLATETGNLQDVGGRLRADGALRDFAEDTVVAIAILVESIAGLLKIIPAIGGSFQAVAADVKLAFNLVRGAATFDNDLIAESLAERERVVREANARYVDLINYNGTAVSDALRAQFQKEQVARNGGVSFIPDFGLPPPIQNSDAIAPLLPGFTPGRPVLNPRPAAEPPRPTGNSQRAAAEAASEAQRLIASLSEQIALYGDLTKAEEVRISLANGYYGVVTPAQSAELQRLAGIIDANAERVEQERQLADLTREAASIYEATRDPVEKLAAEFERLNKLRSTVGADGELLIDAETYERAVIDAQDAFDKISGAGEQTSAELSEYFKSAAQGIQGALADFLFDPFKDGLKGLLNNAIQVIQRIAAEAAAAKIAESIFGVGGGGGGLLDAGIAAAGQFFGGGFANGGNPPIGIPSLVGERGPELIVPRSAMTVIPNGRFGMGGSTTNNVAITVQAPEGRISRATEQQITAAAFRGASRASNRNN